MRSYVDLSVLVTDDAEQRMKRIDEEFTLDDSDATSIALMSGGGDYNLAPSASNTQVSFGGITTTSLILIVAFEEIQVRLGDPAAPLITIPPIPAVTGGVLSVAQKTQQPGVVYMRAQVGSIYLSNPSSSVAARAFVALAGV